MKTIKPLALGVMCRPFEWGRRCFAAFSLVAVAPLDGSELSSEVALWRLVASELGEGAVLDEWLPKPRGELLLTARAYPPGRRPQPVCTARAVLGSVDKRLVVVGRRYWLAGRASEPVPFDEMPIAWSQAYGGAGYDRNPLGKGHVPVDTPEGPVVPLPCIEDPRRPFTAPGVAVEPAGFGAYELTWPQRYRKIGTYDRRWVEEGMPGFAADLDESFFNVAPEDQQLKGFFRGDETLRLENLHPERPLIEGRLPSVRARCFVEQRARDGLVFAEVPLELDTVHLFPHRDQAVLLFRGRLPIAEDDGSDIVTLLAALEDLDEDKGLEHYRAVLAARLDKERGYLLSLRDVDLTPSRCPAARMDGDANLDELPELAPTEDLHGRNTRHGAAKRLAEVREQLRSRGRDPDALGVPVAFPEPPEAPSPGNVAEAVARAEEQAEEHNATLERTKAQAQSELRSRLAARGLDYEAVMADAAKRAGGPPAYSADEQLARLRSIAELWRIGGKPHEQLEQTLADPTLEPRLRKNEHEVREAYRIAAHRFPEAPRLAPDRAAALRGEIEALVRAGESLEGRDWTGAELARIDLSGQRLVGVLAERSDLREARLSDVVATGMVLTRANLEGAFLDGASLSDANLGAVCAAGADFQGADLSKAVLWQADLRGANLCRARLFAADLSEAILAEADLSGVDAREIVLMGADLSGLRLRNARLDKAVLVDCKLNGADLTGASLCQATLVGVEAEGVVLVGADLSQARLVQGCRLPNADLRRARAERANLRGADLTGADLTEATLDGADLSECKLEGARLDRATARGALLVRTDLRRARATRLNLMRAIAQHAKIAGTDFAKSNLFRADLARATGDDRTSFEGSNVEQVRWVKPPLAPK